MTYLRQQMIDAMHQRGFSDRTHQSYLASVRDLARHFHKPPDQIAQPQIQQYFNYLVKERHLSGASCRLHLNGLRFFYLQVLSCEQFDVPIHYPKKVQKIPELLTRDEVKRIIDACANRKHRMMLMVCYGCGLRVSELVAMHGLQRSKRSAMSVISHGYPVRNASRGICCRPICLNPSCRVTRLHLDDVAYRPA